MRAWWLVALVGCEAVESAGVGGTSGETGDPAALPDDAAGPPLPTPMRLTLNEPFFPGGPFQMQVAGAVPGAEVVLVRSAGVPGAGDCPPELDGLCYGMTNVGGYVDTVTATANAQGNVTINASIPATTPVGVQLSWQVVDRLANTGSNVVRRGIIAPLAPCTDDALEPNDTLATARVGLPNPLNDVVACPYDDDWWGFLVPPGQIFSATATFDDALDGDLDLELLLAPAGTLLGASQSSVNHTEVVSFFNRSTQSLRVALRARMYTSALTGPEDPGGIPGVQYDLSTALGAPVYCAPDRFEPDDDALTQAHPLTQGIQRGLTACAADGFDWYTLTLPANRNVRVQAVHDSAEGDIDLYLLPAPMGNDLAAIRAAAVARAYTGLDNDEFTFRTTAPGTYYLLVHLYGDNGLTVVDGNAYDLGVLVSP